MFKLIKVDDKKGRQALIKTAHGSLATPFYMPDATRALVKLTENKELEASNTEALVVNTFHLYLQPGLKIIREAGGIHKFMSWSGPLLSDSGGFQIFSLIHRNKDMGEINDQGVIFKSPLDGSRHKMSPEKSIQIQFDLGTDMMVCLDDCPPNEFDHSALESAVNRTISWAKRCKKEYHKQIEKRKLKGVRRPLLFAVIQGGADLELRKYCAQELVKIGFDGYGFGARPVDQEGNFLEEVLRKTAEFIPERAIRFALGVGTPEDIYRCVKMGWDMFDCVIPTREGRHGKLYLWNNNLKSENGKFSSSYRVININNARFINDFSIINKKSNIFALKQYSYAYLHHLFRLKEPLAYKLASLNNLEFYQQLLAKLRSK